VKTGENHEVLLLNLWAVVFEPNLTQTLKMSQTATKKWISRYETPNLNKLDHKIDVGSGCIAPHSINFNQNTFKYEKKAKNNNNNNISNANIFCLLFAIPLSP
jgi:hypothetical protein